MTPSELTSRARAILGPTRWDAPPWHARQVSLATVAALEASAGKWTEAAARLLEAADVAADRDDARAGKWRQLAAEIHGPPHELLPINELRA